MRFNGNIIGVDNRASVGNTRGLWTLPPQAVARRESRWSVFDQDAATYIAAVESADQQPLELAIKDAIHDFVIGCKADGIWADLKAACILCGARTLTGALVPLVGSAPTSNNFVSGDYDRALGLKGDKSTKYIDSNRAGNADPQNDQHTVCYVTVTDLAAGNLGYMGTANTNTGSIQFGDSLIRARNSTPLSSVTFPTGTNMRRQPGLNGLSRNNGSTFDAINGDNTVTNISQASQTPDSANVDVFRRLTSVYTSARIAYYSIGEATDLLLLEKNVTRLCGAIQGALL